jgi:S1-C subfamily serine protease
MSGLSLLAEGSDLKTIRIHGIVDHSPAADAGLRKEDLITSINGKPTSDFTLMGIRELFKKPGECLLNVKRGDETLNFKVTLRRLI